MTDNNSKQQTQVITMYSTQDCNEVDDNCDLKTFFKQQLTLQMSQLRTELKEDFGKSIRDSETNIKSYIDLKYKELEGSISTNTNLINLVSVKTGEAETLAKQLEKDTQSLGDRIDALEEGNEKLVEEITQLKKDKISNR